MLIKLMPEYECFPLWGYINNELSNINPESLPISKRLKDDLNQWADGYESTYSRNNPIESGFSSELEEKKFLNDAYALKNKLQLELGLSYEIILCL